MKLRLAFLLILPLRDMWPHVNAVTSNHMRRAAAIVLSGGSTSVRGHSGESRNPVSFSGASFLCHDNSKILPQRSN